MRITAKQLRQIIKEEVTGVAGSSTRSATEELGTTEDKMFNARMSVEGLTQAEYEATKGAADTALGDAGFFLIDNTSENPVQVILADFGKVESAQNPFEIGANSRSKLIGFSKKALEREGPRSARILVTGKHNTESIISTVEYTKFKLVRASVSDMLAEPDYVAVLIKLQLGTARVETPSETPEEAPAVAATKITAAVTPEFVAAVTKQPLQVGSKGDNVRIAQRAIKAAIQRFLDTKENSAITQTDITQAQAGEIMRFVPGIPKDASAKQMLAALVEALKVDGDYGNITKAAVRVYQSLAKIAVDGRVGKETATRLQADNMSINESAMIINRWNRLAGLLID